MHVRTHHGRRRHERHAAHGEVLADLGDQRATLLVDRLAAGELQAIDRLDVRRAGGQRRLGDFGREAAEVVATRDEVRLAVHFDQHAGLAVGGLLDDDHAFGGDARGLLVGLRETRLAHVLGGGVQVAVGFDECLLALHHAGAGALAQLLDRICGECSFDLPRTVSTVDQPRRGPPPPPRPRPGGIARAGARTAGAGRGAARSRFARVREHGRIGTVFRIGSNACDHRTTAASAVLAGRRPRCGGGAFGGAAARALLARIAVLVELDELVFAHGDGRSLRTAFDDRIGDAGGIQRDGAHGVIVAGDHVVHVVRRAVGVDHRDHRDAELLGFEDGDLLVAHVDDEDDVRAAIPSA